MASIRPERVAAEIQAAVADLLTRGEIHDPRVGFITITGVKVSPDLSVAQVFYSMIGTDQQKLAVDSGVWPLYRYDPRLVETGKPPLQIDSGAIKANVRDYLRNETRFAMVEKIDPVRFRNLSEASVRNTSQRLALYQELAKISYPSPVAPAAPGATNGHSDKAAP